MSGEVHLDDVPLVKRFKTEPAGPPQLKKAPKYYSKEEAYPTEESTSPITTSPSSFKLSPQSANEEILSPTFKLSPQSANEEILSPSYMDKSRQTKMISPEWDRKIEGGTKPSVKEDPDWCKTEVEKTVNYNTGNSTAEEEGYSSAALKMMRSMGYQEGKGLGAKGQGITAPVEASQQKGHRGLGHYIQGFKTSREEWKEREISTHVHLEWMAAPTKECDLEYFKSPDINKLVGPRKDTTQDETQFVSSEILEEILKSKGIFDQLPDKELREARTKANPFETIANVIFQNRAAMKMAEIDALSNWAFSQKSKNSDNMPLLYFGDIAAGPGGFSEYVLWRTQWHAKGFGMTLKHAPDASDFKLEKFQMGPPECFEPYYGVDGVDGDGDILKPENLDEFQDYVLKQSEGEGLHFVMGDGGIGVEGQENIQEILTKQLLLCQFACALSVLREDGNFVCKTFDLFTPFSVGLVHMLRYAFEKVAIIKPLTSRPANSERYVLCLGCKKEMARTLYQYMFRLNMEIRKRDGTDMDIQHVVPLSDYITDSDFCRYVTQSNDTIGDNQIYNLQKLRAYVKNPALRVPNQQEIREDLLSRWQVPNERRKRPARENPMETAERLLDPTLFRGSPLSLTAETLSAFDSKYSWKCHLDYGKSVLLLGQGFKNVFYFNGEVWTKDPHIQIELPKDTVVEGQVMEVFSGEGSCMRNSYVLLTDAIVIGGQAVHHKPYADRVSLLEKLAQSLEKPSAIKWQKIMSVKSLLYRLENFSSVSKSLQRTFLKGHSAPRLAHCVGDLKIVVHGITFIRHIKEPWNMELSSKLKKFYFFNCKTRTSTYDWPLEAGADFGYTRASSLHWHWDLSLWPQLTEEEPYTHPLLANFIKKCSHNPDKVKPESH